MSERDVAIAAEARRLAALGLLACTGGNFSVRESAQPLVVLMSISGVDKASLQARDFLRVDHQARVLPGRAGKPSDETWLHLALYQHLGDACGAICHGHPPHAVAASMACSDDALVFAGVEMQKAFVGTITHDSRLRLPIIANSQDMHELSARALAAIGDAPALPAVLVRGHGVYAWGSSVAHAGRHLETVEWLCRELHLRTAQPAAPAPAKAGA